MIRSYSINIRYRDFIAETIAQLSPEKIVEVNGSQLVHVTVNKLKGKTMVKLIKVAGEFTNQAAIASDQVPPLIDLTVSVKTPTKPAKIVMQPEGKELKTTWSNGKSTVLIHQLEIHSVLNTIVF